MLIDKFNKEFNLDAYNKANRTLSLCEDDDLYKLFIKFINDRSFLKLAIDQNNLNGISPVVTFLESFPNEIEKIFSSTANSIYKGKRINAIFTYLFLSMNENLYSGSKESDVINDFVYKPPIFVVNETFIEDKKLNVAIENVIFETRSLIYTCPFKRMIKEIGKISKDFDDSVTVYENLLKYCKNSLFDDDEIGADKKVSKYYKNTKEPKTNYFKDDAILFLINKNDESVEKWFSKNTVIGKLKGYISEFFRIWNDDSFDKLRKNSKIDTDGFDSSDNSKSDNEVISKAREIKDNFKSAKFSVRNYYSFKEPLVSNFKQFDDVSKIVSKIDDYLDVLEILNLDGSGGNGQFEILIYLSRFGILNIILLAGFIDMVSWENNGYDSTKDNKLANAAFYASIEIENTANSLAKLFNMVNLNSIIKARYKKKFLFGLPYNIEEDKRSINSLISNAVDIFDEQIYKKTNTYKSIYTRLTFDHGVIHPDDVSPCLFFDLLSFYVSFSHSYDKLTLFQIAAEKEVREEFVPNLGILFSNKTTQINYDDSQLSYIIMDQYTRFLKFNVLINNASKKAENMQSHKHRLYSLWEYPSLTAAIVFGSASLLLNNILLEYLSNDFTLRNNRIRMLFFQHRMAKIYSDLNIKCNHVAFNAKTRNYSLTNKVFDKLGVIESETKLRHIFDSSWQHANLNTNRFYSRIGFYISLSSLVISIIAFAWASAIFIDFDMTDIGIYNFPRLLKAFFDTNKFHLVLIFALIPLLVFLTIYSVESIRNHLINKNLAKFFTKKARKQKGISKFKKKKIISNKSDKGKKSFTN